jgi:hypothetical protein
MFLQDFEGLPEEEAIALLQLAMNCSNPSTAEAAAHRLPEPLETATARQLLLTAAVRQHTAVVEHMISLPVAGQHIDAETLEGMIAQLLPQPECIELLCAIPAAAQLSSEAAARLLLESLKQRQDVAVGQLWGLAGAQQISSELIAELLTGCAPFCTCADTIVDYCLAAISSLPGAAALSSTELVQLLAAVCERGRDMQEYADDNEAAGDGMTLLCVHLLRLPAAAELSTEQLMQPIQKAALFNNAAAMRSSCVRGIAERLSSEMVLQLQLQRVIEADRGACTVTLCSLPAAQELSCEAAAELLATVVKQDKLGPHRKPSKVQMEGILALLVLPAAKELCSATVAQLLHAAAEHGSTKCTVALCHLSAAAQISRSADARLLRTLM